jgi:lantibiotic modifying enzyme
MGRVVVEVDRVGGPITPTSAALGPDLYGGSAGIALFLAELFAATDDPECRRTALGAIARSIRQLDRLPEGSPSPLSFFVGHLGVAFAADRVGRLTGDLGVRTRAEALLDRVAEAATAPHLLDVISGNAGAIPALLALGRDPARRRCVALATA